MNQNKWMCIRVIYTQNLYQSKGQTFPWGAGITLSFFPPVLKPPLATFPFQSL